ncbi:MAG: type II secretion system GspH family protein [Candidatus Colwellbacteria bacterium]|nr:type II secretion system GspH family protein [Candidatus Colwellbacteria bacterium]
MRKVEEYSGVGTGGFTLIEMLIVIAVISILAGIVLVGITGFQESARDTKRIADVRGIQNNLELYFTRCGNYPIVQGNATNGCDGGNAITAVTVGDNWQTLGNAFVNVGILPDVNKMPGYPEDTTRYFYDADATGSTYIVGVQLENPSGAFDDRDEIDQNTSGYTGITLTRCSDDTTNQGYCIGLN